MNSVATWSLYDERLGPEWANRSLSHSTFVTEDVFEAVAHLVPAALKARFLGANEDERACILFEDVFDHVNRIAPLDCFFGPHPGNASDFGFWQIPSQCDNFTAHEVKLDDQKRYFRYNKVTDTYSEEVLPGDLGPFHIPLSYKFKMEEILVALEGKGVSETIRSYVIFLERIAGPLLYS